MNKFFRVISVFVFIHSEVNVFEIDFLAITINNIISANCSIVFFEAAVHAPTQDFSVFNEDITLIAVQLDCVSANATDFTAFDIKGITRLYGSAFDCI